MKGRRPPKQPMTGGTSGKPNKAGDKSAVDLTHMPQFIKEAPWYLDQDKEAPVLQHQRQMYEQKKSSIALYHKRSIYNTSQLTKFRKGACTNCGAMGHTHKVCVERPRKVGAEFTGEQMGKDQTLDQVSLDYEGKHDRWNGYDPATYKYVVDEWEALEDERNKQRLIQQITKAKEKGSQSSGSEEDSDLEQGEQQQFVNKDPKVRTAIRNLRQREDVAKYLRNLDPSSARYDGKSRIMKENPNPHLDESKQTFKGDNWVKFTGDAVDLMKMEAFMFETNDIMKQQMPHQNEAGELAEVNTMGVPTQISMLQKEHEKRALNRKDSALQKLLTQYGGEKHMRVPEEVKFEKEVMVAKSAETELMRFAQTGESAKPVRVTSHHEGLVGGISSKYPEDEFTDAHVSVWGSAYCMESGRWGYQCCLLFEKKSGQKCRGEIARNEVLMARAMEEAKAAAEVEAEEVRKRKLEEESDESSQQNDSSSDSSSSNSSKSAHSKSSSNRKRRFERKRDKKTRKKEQLQEKKDDISPIGRKKTRKLDEKKVQEILRKLDEQEKLGGREYAETKKPFFSLKADAEITAEELEAYRLKRQRFDDPMLNN